MPRVLFSGLGVMGLPMARDLAASGRAEVLAHDTDAERLAGSGLAAGDPVTEAGLDPAATLDVVNPSTGRSQATEVEFGPQVLSGAFDAGFALDLMVEDLRTTQGLAREAGATTPLADAVVDAAARTQAESEDGSSHPDHTVLARWVAARTGATLHGGDT